MPETKDVAHKNRAIIKFLDEQVWAIVPAHLDTIKSVIADHMAGLDVKVELPTAKAVGNVNYPNVAIIPIHGTFTKRSHPFASLSGEVSGESIKSAIDSALNDNAIDAIVLDIESPGGTVDGTMELADYIYSIRGKKPIVSYANGLMASALYWIGSSADKIVAFDTTQVGSIGVVMSHFDYSKAYDTAGVKPTVMHSGKYKAFGNKFEPLTEESKQYIQDNLDAYYTLFVDGVARNRGTTAEEVLSKMADGRIFIGREAKRAGLIDKVGNMEAAIKLALSLVKGEQKMADEKATVDMTQLQAQMAEMQKNLELTTKQLQEANAKAEARENELKAEREAAALKEKKATMSASLGKYGAKDNTALVDALVAMGDSSSVVLAMFDAMQTKIDTFAKELGQETAGATTQDAKDGQPRTIDEAIALVSKENPKMDIEEAEEKAMSQFPELFKTNE